MNDFSITTAATPAEAMGRMVAICIKQQVYMDWNIWDMERLFLPPAQGQQYRIFQNGSDDVGFFTWAQLSNEVSNYLIKYGADPRDYEWKCGKRLWLIDIVADPKFSRRIGTAIRREIFTPDFVVEHEIDDSVKAHALRRNKDKSIRKVATISFMK